MGIPMEIRYLIDSVKIGCSINEWVEGNIEFISYQEKWPGNGRHGMKLR